MSLTQRKIVTDGLVFAYDAYINDRMISKSYQGKPTVNYAWNQNPRIDTSYAPYVNTTAGTWPSNHPKAIRVYNKAGSEISAYVNGGVTNYTNTYHGVWEWDAELRRPVVVLKNLDGSNWKAKSWSIGKTYTQMGMTTGDQYTISWLQWTDKTSRAVNAGIYGTNTSGSNNFHDGLSNSIATSFNTLPYTWQRVYATFTIAPTNNTATNRSCYMYGQYLGAGILKIADVQIEAGVPSAFIAENSEANSTRSTSGVLIDWTGNNTITANSLTYNTDGTFGFNGTTNFARFGNNSAISGIGGTSSITVEAWVKYDSYVGSGGARSYSVVTHKGTPWTWLMENPNNRGRIRFTIGGTDVNCSDPDVHPLNTWMHWVGTYDGSNMRFYRNGVLKNTVARTGTLGSNSVNAEIGQFSNDYRMDGNISIVKIYNRSLMAPEVQQNFNALRGRYGI